MVRRQSHPVGIKEIMIPAALFVAVVLWIVIQNATWTPASWHHPIWAMAADALGKPVAGSISVNRDLTTLALMRLITSASVFWLAASALPECGAGSFLRDCHCRHHYRLCGLWPRGICADAGNDTVDRQYLVTHGYVTSTFYDRSHFATYAGIGLVVMCGLILRLYGHTVATTGGSLRFRMASVIEVTGQKARMLLAGAVLILVAILLTGSRGGLIATGFGLLSLGVSVAWRPQPGIPANAQFLSLERFLSL